MTAETAESIGERIKEVLHLVIDPELGYNIVDLGLVYDVAVKDGGAAHIRMTTTTRGCPATDYLVNGAEAAARAVPNIRSVDVELTYDPPWTPNMMTLEAKEHLGIASR